MESGTEHDAGRRDRKFLVGLGELLWDCYEHAREPGGAPANVAFHAQQLGARGGIVSRVGSDPLGDALIDELARRRIDPAGIQRDAERPTGTVTIESTASGEPCYGIRSHAAWDFLEPTEEALALCASADAICFGTLALRHDRSRAAIEACLGAAVKAYKVYDVNLRQSFYTPQRVRAAVRAADLVKLNAHEAAVVPALLEIAPVKPEQLAAWMLDQGVKLVSITRGAAGCELFSATEHLDLPGEASAATDPVGAGDAFTAALVVALLEGASLAAAGGFANRVGARVAAAAGAMPSIDGLRWNG
jgi:fructokinase